MTDQPGIERIEATITYADGQTVQVLLADDADSAWGNYADVVARTVDARAAILEALRDGGHLHVEGACGGCGIGVELCDPQSPCCGACTHPDVEDGERG